MNDYARDPVTNDLLIVNGDFVSAESTEQHQKSLILAEPGAYKQFPTVGVGIASYLKDDNQNDMMRAIRLQFSGDGMQINKIDFTDGKLKISASYGG